MPKRINQGCELTITDVAKQGSEVRLALRGALERRHVFGLDKAVEEEVLLEGAERFPFLVFFFSVFRHPRLVRGGPSLPITSPAYNLAVIGWASLLLAVAPLPPCRPTAKAPATISHIRSQPTIWVRMRGKNPFNPSQGEKDWSTQSAKRQSNGRLQ